MSLRGSFCPNMRLLTVSAALLLSLYSLAQTAGQPNQPAFNFGQSYDGVMVQNISFVGIPDPNSGSLMKIIPQKPGEPLDRERVRESIRVLYATGRFADIRGEIDRLSGGPVLLEFVLTPNYFVGEVRAEGAAARPTANQIVNASKLQLGEVLAPEKIERALTNIRQLMEQEGYYHSEIQEQEKTHTDTQQVDVLFNIRPGEHARVGQVLVTGNPGYSQGQIQDIAKIHPGDEVSVQLLSRALDRLQKKYQKHSRLLAQVTIAKRVYRPSLNRVDYTFNIDPGPRVYIDTEGFKISRGVLKKNVPVYEENAVDDDLLNEGRRNLISYLQKRGYFDAKVTFRKISNSSNEFRVLYVIDPDGLSRLRLQVLVLAGARQDRFQDRVRPFHGRGRRRFRRRRPGGFGGRGLLAGPRAGQNLINGGKALAAMDGRFSVAIDDVKKVAIPVLRHRISTNFQAQAEGVSTEDIIEKLLKTIGEPDIGKYDKKKK